MFLPRKITEFTEFKVEVRAVLYENGKHKVEVYCFESEKLLELDVSEKIAQKIEGFLLGQGYVSAKLETSMDGTITGEVLSFYPCDQTITFDDVEESFREAFRDTSVQDFLLSERGEQ